MENTQVNYIDTHRTARYATYGRLSEHTQYCWIALHGSHMTCEQLLYKFKDFNPEEHFVIAPEGLNKHYLNGFGGEVVASWMTSRDRLHEIEDFSTYLTSLYDLYNGQLPPLCKKVAFGFSQGGTTMYRWLHHSKIDVDVVVGYSCWIPEDIDLRQSKTPLSTIRQLYTIGDEDEYMNEQNMSKINQVIQKNGLDIPIYRYKGDHRINRSQLQYLFQSEIA